MIDRAQPAQPKQLGQPVGIDLITLVALADHPPPITDDHPIGDRRHQIVQPLRLGPHLEGDVQRPSHAAEELDDRRPVCLQDAPGEQPPAVIPYLGDRGCLRHVKRYILRRSLHESRSLLWSLGSCRLRGSSKGRAFNMR